jgi:hypothetical protein
MIGWTFLSQSPVRNPDDAPTQIHAPILGKNPATEDKQIPPDKDPTSESLRLSLPLKLPEI